MTTLDASAAGRFLALSRTKADRELSPQENGELARLLGKLSAVPRLGAVDTQRLLADMSFLHSAALSLLFLQGDFGNCFYIIVTGGVGLYVNRSTERENENSRDIGSYRGLPLPNPQQALEALGENVANLTAGAGFGEYALLSVTKRYRGASAVIASNSLLIVVPEQCYNAVFRRHHLRQQKMADGLAVLEKHPFFSCCSYAKLVQIAFSMQCLTLGARKPLVRAGDRVTSAFVVAKGAVTAFAAQTRDRPGAGVLGGLRLAVAQLGHGCMVGELEIAEGRDTFMCSYETTSECELFEIPRAALQDILRVVSILQGHAQPAGRVVDTSCRSGGLSVHLHRTQRVSAAVRDTFHQMRSEREACETLQSLLPLLSGVRTKPPVSSRKDVSSAAHISSKPQPPFTSIIPVLDSSWAKSTTLTAVKEDFIAVADPVRPLPEKSSDFPSGRQRRHVKWGKQKI